jgi:NADPH-dependent 2,4-dienoyl-CoA reductase/sulfur reductase-like enzyme
VVLRASGARVFSGWRVIHAGEDQTLSALRQEGEESAQIDIRYRALILATGARERLLPFPGWRLPGVCGALELQGRAMAGMSIARKRIVVAGSGLVLLAASARLRQMGARVTTVAEQTDRMCLAGFFARHPRTLRRVLELRAAAGGSRYRAGCWPVAALGGSRLEAVELSRGDRRWIEPCDLLACSFFSVPDTELASMLGCRLCRDAIETGEVQQTTVPGVFAAGAAAGLAGLDAALLTGTIAGLAAAGRQAEARALAPQRGRMELFGAALRRCFDLRPEVLALA